MESDHISERDMAEAYHQGWNDFPRKLFGDNPLRNSHPLLAQCWEQGWIHHEQDDDDDE